MSKLQFLGSSCIYPRLAPQPMPEDCLLTGPLEPTNEWYAVAKIAGIKMCQAYRKQYGFDAISLMPTNLYGPGDNFSLENSHVLPALIRRFHDAKRAGQEKVVVWGTGSPRREFLYVDDLADACLFLMNSYEGAELINVGVGADVTILELATLVKDVVGFEGPSGISIRQSWMERRGSSWMCRAFMPWDGEPVQACAKVLSGRIGGMWITRVSRGVNASVPFLFGGAVLAYRTPISTSALLYKSLALPSGDIDNAVFARVSCLPFQYTCSGIT